MTAVVAAHEPVTPTRGRRILRWICLGLAFLVLGAALFTVASGNERAQRGALDPESHGPEGFRALTNVLSEQGVEVTITRSWTDAVAAADGGTLAFTDVPALSDDALAQLLDAGADVVLLEPSGRTLDTALDASFGGYGGELTASCSLPAAENAATIVAGQLYIGADLTCFPGSEGSALVTAERGDATVTAIDATTTFTNSTISQAGNAALALSLLGAHDTLVWYVPGVADSDLADPASALADLTPGWVTPVLVLAGLTVAAAAVWRGRRFGPLVAERLPVTVRVSETLEGRARLYARSRDAAHAGAVLRRTATASIGTRLGLGRRSPVTAVADAAAAALGVPAPQVRAILDGPPPADDSSLLRLSDSLTRLEAAIGAAVRAEGKRP